MLANSTVRCPSVKLLMIEGRACLQLAMQISEFGGAGIQLGEFSRGLSSASQQQEHQEQQGLPAGKGQRHWLDRRLPGARQWLEAQNRRWWLRGLLARMQDHHQFHGREEFLQEGLHARYEQLLQRHAHRCMDERAETHVQVCGSWGGGG